MTIVNTGKHLGKMLKNRGFSMFLRAAGSLFDHPTRKSIEVG